MLHPPKTETNPDAGSKPNLMNDFNGKSPELGQTNTPQASAASYTRNIRPSQTMSASNTGDRVAPNLVNDVLRKQGKPLSPSVKIAMESQFNADFSSVRLHDNDAAAASAHAVNAKAYTVGNHIAFGKNQLRPETEVGRRLLAHELAHTLQQPRNANLAAPIPMETNGSPAEYSARLAGTNAAAGTKTQNVGSISRASVQRDPVAADAPPAPVPVPEAPPATHEEREIASFDVDPGNKRPWNLNKLTGALATELLASPRAYVRIFGVYPTKANDDDPQQNAMDRAESVKKALVQWMGPARFPETRFETAFADGTIGDPQIRVDIAFHPEIISNGSGGGPEVKEAPGAPAPVPAPKAADPAGTAVAAAIQYAWHMNVTGPKGTSKDRTLQLQIGSDRFFQLSYNIDTKQVQVLAGAQITGDVPLPDAWVNAIGKMVKLQWFIQIAGGVAWTGSPASGTMAVLQPSLGGQLSYTKGPVNFALQGSGGGTATTGQPTTADANFTGQITFTF